VGLYSTNNPPLFSTQPQNITVPTGGTANFVTIVDGSPTIGQVWYRNGQPILLGTNLATAATLTLTNLSYADAIGKTYYCVATNGSGAVTSSVVTLTVVPQPAFALLTNNLVLQMRFDGNYLDTSGKNHHGTPSGSPTFVPGVIGSQAIRYATTVDVPSGHGGNVVTADYVSLGTFAGGSDLSFSNNVSFSVAYWIKHDTNTSSGDLPVFASANNSYGNAGLVFAPTYNTSTAGGWSWSLGDGGTFVGIYGAAGSINNGQWHHLVHTFNRVSGDATTYLDGTQVDRRGFSVLDDIDSGNPFTIGQDPTGLYPEAGTNYVDDLSVWKNRVLTSSEAYSAFYVGRNFGRSYDTVYPITIEMTVVDGNRYIVWQAGTLQWADDVTGPYTAVPAATAPYYLLSPTATKKFFRVAQ
jgi:hypothetical protein